MKRYLLLGGLLAAIIGCHAPYKEMDPIDRVALLNDKTPPPTTPSWQQTHSTPLAYRNPTNAAQASNSFVPNGSAPGSNLKRPFPPTAVAMGNPNDKQTEPAKATPRLQPAPAVRAFETNPERGSYGSPIQQTSSTSLRPNSDERNETPEPPMATSNNNTPRPFPKIDEPIKPIVRTSHQEESTDKGIGRTSGVSGPAVRMVNSKRISLNYELKDVGPSGISAIELYVTRDGKDWAKDDKALRSGPPFIVEVDEEGMYGFTIVARSGLGLGKTPPKPGETPQVWVEVDLSRPDVKIQEVKHGLGVKAREININWSANDRNLTRRPITLLYAEKADGPWTPIAANIENTGNYVWQSPTNAPTQFFIRVEAVDLVGNIGLSQTNKALVIDMSQPSVSILAVDPAK